MIALDSQPLSVVDDKGFVSLLNTLEPRYVIPSRKYVTETVLPHIHDGIKANVKMELNGLALLVISGVQKLVMTP